MKKTPAEIEAMAKDAIPNEWPALHTSIKGMIENGYFKGYTSNTELEEFKKELVEKVKILMERYWAEDDIERGRQLAYQQILHLITQEDQPEVKKEEKIGPKMIICPQCNKLRDSENIKKYGMCFNCHY